MRLRQASQDLLQRLRMKQEKMRKELPRKQLLPAPHHGTVSAERLIHLSRRVVCVLCVLEIQGANGPL